MKVSVSAYVVSARIYAKWLAMDSLDKIELVLDYIGIDEANEELVADFVVRHLVE